MLFFFWVRRLNLVAGILNLLFSLSFLGCIIIIICYQVNLISNNFSAIATENSNQTGSNIIFQGDQTIVFIRSIIAKKGFAFYFKTTLGLIKNTWVLLHIFFLMTIIFYVFQQVLNILLFYFNWRIKNINLLTNSIIIFFFPFIGFIYSIKVWNITSIEIKKLFLKRTKQISSEKI